MTGALGVFAARLPAPLDGYALDHIALAVIDLDAATLDWERFGGQREGDDETVVGQGVTVRTMLVAGVTLELLSALTPDSPVGRFLARRGAGLHHVALRVHDLTADLARLAAADVALIDRVPRAGRAGSRVAFLHPSSMGGVLVELVEPAAAAPRHVEPR